MAFLGKTYNSEDLPKANKFEPIPEGWYQVAVKSCELKTTKAGNGQYLNVGLVVLAPTHEGRMIFNIINIDNPSSSCLEMGLIQFNSLMSAAGLKSVTDSDQFIGAEIEAKVSIKSSPGYEPKNDVSEYRAINGSLMPSAPANAPAESTKPAGQKAPWQK